MSRPEGSAALECLEFTYRIHGGEMFVDRKTKSITRSTVMTAYRRALEQNCFVSGPKKLGTFGASYLYPGIFMDRDYFLLNSEKCKIFSVVLLGFL